MLKQLVNYINLSKECDGFDLFNLRNHQNNTPLSSARGQLVAVTLPSLHNDYYVPTRASKKQPITTQRFLVRGLGTFCYYKVRSAVISLSVNQ